MDFHKAKRYKDGHASYCKSCHSSYYEKYYLENRATYKKRAAEDFQKNKPAYYARKNAYRSKLNSVELTDDEKRRIEDFYWLAKDLQAVTGEPYEVDHIHPISKGGLHHPDNLQVLPRDLNRKKSDNT